MEKQKAAESPEVGGAGPPGTEASVQDGAAAGLHLPGTGLPCAGLCSGPLSGSTNERPRGILKHPSSLPRPRVPQGRKKSQHWDEMNILATYHPLGKDYGLMKVDEPSTPYRRLEDSDEDLRAGTSQAVSPESLAERLASLDNFCPKVLQLVDNKNAGSKDKFTSKKMQKDFEYQRKAHYDEGKYLKAHKLTEQDDEEGTPESPDTPVGGSHALPQSPSEREFDRRRKEYYSKGTYLKLAIPTDSEEDSDKEQKDDKTLRLHWSQEEDTVQWKM